MADVARADLRDRATTFEDPVARALVFAQWSDMAVRYGGPPPCSEDDAVPHGSFEPPEGLFLVVEGADGTPLGCAGYRPCDEGPPGTAEVKRLWVVPEARGLGVARFVMARLEEEAAAAAYEQMWLETGTAQPEAIGLYASMGYDRIAPYGEYRDSPRSVSFAKRLRVAGAEVLDRGNMSGQPS